MTILFATDRRVNRNRLFGLGIAPVRRHDLPLDHTAADEAWASGFALALDGIPADPSSDLTPWQAECFVAGYEAGALALEVERNAANDLESDRLDATVGRYLPGELDTLGAGGGYDDDASFADDYYSALASEGNTL